MKKLFLLLSLVCALLMAAPALAAAPLPLAAEVLRPAAHVSEGLPALLWVGLGILGAAGVYELRRMWFNS